MRNPCSGPRRTAGGACETLVREINDLSYREIADVVGAPVGTVMRARARARPARRLDRRTQRSITMICDEAGTLVHALDGELDAGTREAELTSQAARCAAHHGLS
jgi:hypothetical protein